MLHSCQLLCSLFLSFDFGGVRLWMSVFLWAALGVPVAHLRVGVRAHLSSCGNNCLSSLGFVYLRIAVRVFSCRSLTPIRTCGCLSQYGAQRTSAPFFIFVTCVYISSFSVYIYFCIYIHTYIPLSPIRNCGAFRRRFHTYIHSSFGADFSLSSVGVCAICGHLPFSKRVGAMVAQCQCGLLTRSRPCLSF